MKKYSKKEEIPKEAISPIQKNEEFLKKIIKEDSLVLERIKELSGLLKTKYKISTKDLIYLTDDKEVLIPVSIFTKRLRVLETLTKYLKEELNFSYHQIGILLNRNERNLWHTYKNACKKQAEKLTIPSSRHFLPISIFQNKLSILENIVLYLKDELNLSYHNVAVLIERNDSTIWTMYRRAKNKIKNE